VNSAPAPKSHVTVTLYKKVPVSESQKFYKDLVSNGGQLWLRRAKVISGAVPFSHFQYEVDHSAGEKVTQLFPSEKATVPLSDYAILPSMSAVSAISFPQLQPVKSPISESVSCHAKIPGGHSSSIIFPGLVSYPTRKPPLASLPSLPITSSPIPTEKTTKIPEKEPSSPIEEIDNSLIDEFVEWVKATSAEQPDQQINKNGRRAHGSAKQEQPLPNSRSLIRKSKKGQPARHQEIRRKLHRLR